MADNILDRFKENTEETIIDTSRKIRVGIIGTGWIAEAHLESYRHQPDVEIVAGADLVEGKAEAFFDQAEAYIGLSDLPALELDPLAQDEEET